VFRRVLGVPENMASHLRAALPPDVAARLDLGRLARVPGSFVDEALKWRHSDLLFTAPLAGRDALVYVLVEHQSSNDPLMAFRMLRYITRIWDRYLDDHPRTRQLPAVIPVVVHQGPGQWSGAEQLLDLIDLDPVGKKAMQDWLPSFRYLLDDLATTGTEQLRDRGLTPQALVTLLLLKTAAGNPRLSDELRPWASHLRAALDQPGGGEAFIALLTYIELVSETPASELHDLAASLGPDAEEAYMTTAEMLRAEGRAEGRAEARTEGLAEALVQVLTIKFGTIPEDVHTKVRAASSGQVREWTARAITAGKLDEVFS
jgi:predicted transposase/invertase (TIGR01784 family)